MNIRWLGHSCFEITEGDTRILIDPFLNGNPKAPIGPEDVDPNVILLTHGHGDHFGDVIEIAKRTGAQVFAIVEIAHELTAAGVENVVGFNIGGTAPFEGGSVRLTPAWHTSTTPGGTQNTPAGLVVKAGGKTVYHLGDTALFSDIALVPARDHVDVAIIPVGGFYTMDEQDGVEAAKLVQADTVVPCHYMTFPALLQDASGYKAAVEEQTSSRVVLLDPGESFDV